MTRLRWSQSSLFATAGLVLLAAGGFHYLAFRDFEHTVFGSIVAGWIGPALAGSGPGVAWNGWISAGPSFLHVVAFTLLSWAVIGPRRNALWIAPASWAALNMAFELGQSAILPSWRFPGTFDGYDIAAAMLGGIVAYLGGLVVYRAQPGTNRRRFGPLPRKLCTFVLFPVGILSITASFEMQEMYYEPIYLSYDELRAAVKTEPTRPLTRLGKIYTYQHWLLVNEPNQGVHLFDNSDPAQPRYHVFIVVPGNVDIAVRDGYLYVDSYVDLATIDLNDPANIREVNRVNDVFPYDPYQNITENIVLDSADPTLGVVIGYKISYRDVDDNAQPEK